ncbi:ribonuclease P protein component [Thermosipho atlanticus]|uniref:Ribonuclease P protein component n=1 Tax=Thermosipho atlanticus DSM 15807 TaxID=1123380 RepID=A0A1M5R9N1_9BACT|nr:ribonuclease P protein component [Thermosipho atlanticus]SHH23067.1 ribonuclease P protein component [Thermosipho atlanticus DSM 15807]
MEISSLKTNTFRKYERLKLRKDILNVIRNGKGIQNDWFVVLYIRNGLDYSRYAFSVKKKFGKAVKRNKLKRWLRESIRNNKSTIPKGYDYLIIARKKLSDQFENITYKEFLSEFLAMFERVSNEKNS